MPTIVHRATFERLPPETLAAWKSIPVTIASDIAGLPIVIDPLIRPLRAFAPGRRMAGQAVTAWCERSDFGAMLHALDMARAGEVVTVDAGGCRETAYCGEILCGYVRKKKIAGLVVNGAVRDIDTIAAWEDFPLFALGNTAKGPLSKERGHVNGTITLGGVVVQPGDIVLGDNDGVAIIPLARAAELLSLAQQRVKMEAEWMAALEKGGSLVETFSVPEAI
ncbi:RraA family protein [Aestuariivirga sp.]|uniref:RraA family protein n=1 Tax=Aestuariivirga sp. TaxID=2650926 RepID=UPI0039E36F10